LLAARGDFAELVYRATRPFPREEMFGLTSQMRRAAVSISSNLAEGSSRRSPVDFARFTEIAVGSLFEVVTQSEIAKRQGFLAHLNHQEIYGEAEILGKMLNSLKASLLEKPNN
jgi:four helix bundle protein